MTIKDLCKVTSSCDKCSFEPACPFSVGPWGNTPSSFNNEHNDTVTNAIIETAKRLDDTGKWIKRSPRWIPSISMTVRDAYECSKCGEPGIKYWHHCIRCGSPMKIEEIPE